MSNEEFQKRYFEALNKMEQFKEARDAHTRRVGSPSAPGTVTRTLNLSPAAKTPKAPAATVSKLFSSVGGVFSSFPLGSGWNRLNDDDQDYAKPSTVLTAAERRRQRMFWLPEDEWQTCEKNIFFPVGHLKQSWDFLIMVLVMYACIAVPYRAAFEEADGLWFIFETALQLLFCVDVVFNFNTAYLDDERWIVHRPRIWRSYLSFWFWIDAPSSIPLELIERMWFRQGSKLRGSTLCARQEYARSARRYITSFLWPKGPPSSCLVLLSDFSMQPTVRACFLRRVLPSVSDQAEHMLPLMRALRLFKLVRLLKLLRLAEQVAA